MPNRMQRVNPEKIMRQQISIWKTIHQAFSILFILFFLNGCGMPKPEMLMSTPVLFSDSSIDPFLHLSEEDKTTETSIFYATNREPQNSTNPDLPYGNKVSNYLHFGQATVALGDKNISWQDLYMASLRADRSSPVRLSLKETRERASIDPHKIMAEPDKLSPSMLTFAKEIDEELAKDEDKEIMLYVHGAKGSFLSSATITAELDHFTGRDFVSFAFAWPSHQNILTYVLGIDGRRAAHSTLSLNSTIEFLAHHTQARHINIICYSAGARLTSRALFELRMSHPEMMPYQLKNEFKLGTVIFTASDVPLNDFLQRLPAISEMTENIVVTVSDNDNVLRAAGIIMGGEDRIGSGEAEIREEAFAVANDISSFEIIDLSHGKKDRGFDIVGHHYWYRHPWASSDIIFILRTGLIAPLRGLEASDIDDTWYLSKDYPQKARQAVRRELENQW